MSTTATMKRSPPPHGTSQSKKMCREERRQPTPTQVFRATEPSQSLHKEGEVIRKTTIHQTGVSAATGETFLKPLQFPRQTTYLSPGTKLSDSWRDAFLTKQHPSPQENGSTNGYMNAGDYISSHAQTTFQQTQDVSTAPVAANVELDFGGPPPYLPLREACDETIQDVYKSGPLETLFTQCNDDVRRSIVTCVKSRSETREKCGNSEAPQSSHFTRCNEVASPPTLKDVRNTSQDQDRSKRSEKSVTSAFTQRSEGIRKLTEKCVENANERNAPLSRKSPKQRNALDELCKKILNTRERIKNEEIDWKKKVLHRLEAVIIKKLLRVERETGKKADIDIPREDTKKGSPSKRKAKRRNSSVSHSKKELSDGGEKELRNSIKTTGEKEEDNTNLKPVENYNGDSTQLDSLNCKMNNPQISTRQDNNQEHESRVSCDNLENICTDTETVPDETAVTAEKLKIIGTENSRCDENKEYELEQLGTDKNAEVQRNGVSTEIAPVLTCLDTCSLQEKRETTDVDYDASSKPAGDYDRNIWSYLKSFTG